MNVYTPGRDRRKNLLLFAGEVKDIKDNVQRRSLLDRVFFVESLTLLSRDRTHPALTLKHVPRAGRVFELVERFRSMTPAQRRSAVRTRSR